MLERLRPAIFSQMLVVPLFHRHRILTEVAADNVNIIKLLPPLICGQAEIDYFVNALDDVLERRTQRHRTGVRVRLHHGQRGHQAHGPGQTRRSVSSKGPRNSRQWHWRWRKSWRRRGGSSGGGCALTLAHISDPQSEAQGLFIERGDRVVVTGAAGFIGSAVVRATLAPGRVR